MTRELTRAHILEALAPIQEPYLKKSLVELGMIRDMMVKEDSLSITVLLTQVEPESQQAIQQQIQNYVEHIGAVQVHIRFRACNEFEMEQLEKKGTLLSEATQTASSSSHAKSDAKEPQTATGTGQAQGLSPILGPDSKTAFIAVASGKGGVGKSTVTVNLAVALARLGKKVGIIDADIYGFSIPDMLGIEERPFVVNERVIPIERFGVKVMSMGFFVEDNSPVIWRGPMLGKMLRNFFAEVEWGDLDVLLLDLPPGTGDVALDVHQMIPQSKEIIVTTPHATAAFVAARAGAMARHTSHEVLGVVENMAYYMCPHCDKPDYVFGRGGGGKLAEELSTELLAQIPLRAPDNHYTEKDFAPSVYKEQDPTGKIYLELAQRVLQTI
ncbi:Mrp/NBP35 family ATP-binding protein [Marinicrinis sediminis]|uniref:Iron-sulfur cluster carrier protein n=1 Tax=Marinicrinis sediminis TaxID=1652465 RepID=A0ABW5RCS6_9BACL